MVGCHRYHNGGEDAHPTSAENHNGKELELHGEALQVVHINFGRSLVARLLVSDQLLAPIGVLGAPTLFQTKSSNGRPRAPLIP